jgi:lysozyme
MTNPTKLSDHARALLIQWEGFKAKQYLDSAGLPTIGVGHLITPDERTSKQIKIGTTLVSTTATLTDAQVNTLLIQDLVRFETAVTSFVVVDLTQNQYDALVSFAFNLGTTTLKTSTLLKELNIKNYDAVPAQMRRFVNSDGHPVPGLVNRRENEVKLWLGTI